jgi:outer membrane protein TolC
LAREPQQTNLLEVFMLRITPKDQGPKLTLSLEGKLSGAWVQELAQAWAEAKAQTPPAEITIDLRLVWFLDEPGRALLTRIHQEGGGLLGSGTYVGPIIEAILSGAETGSAPLRFCWMAALGLAAAGALAAADAPVNLTLNQALQTALAQNPDVHQSLLAIAQSQEDRRVAASAFMPAVEATAMGQRSRLNMDTLLGAPSPGGTYIVGPYNYGLAGLQASVPLFDLSLWNRWKAARHGEQSAKAKARAQREAITALVVSQYLRAQRSAEALKAAQSRIDLAQALEQLAGDQQKHGVGTKLDTLRAQVQVQNERQRLIQAQTQLQAARFGLIKLLNLEPTTNLTLADTLAAPVLPQFTYQEAVTAGLRQRPELEALDARERGAESLKEAARNLRLPTVVATGSYGSTGLEGHTWINTYTVGVGVRVPLFTGGRISAETAKAKLELLRIQDERKGLTAQVSLEVQVAQAELAAEASEVTVTTQAVALAEEVLVQSRHRFEAGVSNNIEVINAQDELARATDNRINALYRLNQSRADLARAMGQLEPLFAR